MYAPAAPYTRRVYIAARV